MRAPNRLRLLAPLLLLLILLSSSLSSSPPDVRESVGELLRRLESKRPSSSVQVAAAHALLQRLLPTHNSSFRFEIIPKVGTLVRHAVTHNVLVCYRYVDRSLPGGTTKIDRRRLIEGEKEKKKKMKIRKKKEEEKKKEYLASSSPTCHHRPRAAVALTRGSSPPSLAIFLPRGEKDRGDIML
ncbi:hypothetical protein B296_00037343 [Ensete ventricosum]|uniref:Uncharacterized protein n=1 Tax=Ensete ventricosum TaxID=4639 RepID=A0A426ZFR9_ENSVE|nr:hypothetical protein B296_00037343 [Ensete ventricosum]